VHAQLALTEEIVKERLIHASPTLVKTEVSVLLSPLTPTHVHAQLALKEEIVNQWMINVNQTLARMAVFVMLMMPVSLSVAVHEGSLVQAAK